MAIHLALSILAVITSTLFTDGNKLSLEDMDSIKISLLPESESPLFVSDKDKPILRYGFHRTHDCKNFEKAFICVRKCLDLNYHIAHADTNCICTCYKNRILAQYKAPIDTAATKWKLGAPTTSRPPWAGGVIEKKPKDYEINPNYTEFVDEPTSPATEAETMDDSMTTDDTNNLGHSDTDDYHTTDDDTTADTGDAADTEDAADTGDTATDSTDTAPES